MSKPTAIDRARQLLAEGRNQDAADFASDAARTLKDDPVPLADALALWATALVRSGRHEEARPQFERAVELMEGCGRMESGGLMALSLLEELHAHLSEEERRAIYLRADELLSSTEDAAILERLRVAARRLIETPPKPSESRFIYGSEETEAILRRAWRAAVTNNTVLITGETGTGKELLARMIHERSGRAGRFVAVNCRAMNSLLIESQLFGHMKGSFEDALRDHPGAVREAAGGTLFLDEVGEMTGTNQARLLRLIERGEVHTIGANTPEQMDVRVIASSACDLAQEAATGRFREDLFYRLQTFHLEIPPLRARRADITAMARHFIEEACRQHKKRVSFSYESMEAIRELPLKGNARTLRALIERIVLLADDGALVTVSTIEGIASGLEPKATEEQPWQGCSLEKEVLSYEKSLIRMALESAEGKVTGAAHLLGVTHQLLSFILNTRHRDLLDSRTVLRRRRRSSSSGIKAQRKPDKK